MAQYTTIQEFINAEKWKGDNYATMFEFLTWEVWDKRDNSGGGVNFSIDNTEGGDGILYVAAGTPVSVGDYVIREADNSLSVYDGVDFEAKYKKV